MVVSRRQLWDSEPEEVGMWIFQGIASKIPISISFGLSRNSFLYYFYQMSQAGLKLLPVETPDGYSDKNDTEDYRRDQRQP